MKYGIIGNSSNAGKVKEKITLYMKKRISKILKNLYLYCN